MRRLAILLALVAAAPASGAELLVVGRGGTTLTGPKAVTAKRTRAHGCRVPARTALAALLASKLAVRVRDYGGCAPGGLYVRSVAGQNERGRDGWVYKLAHDTPGSSAAEPSQRTRGRVLWFWCVSGRHGCQRTLDAKATRTNADEVRVVVTAYDDNGKGIPAAGAHVRCGGVIATTREDGGVTLVAGRDCDRVVATQDGRVRSFPVPVR
jgi:hypothetical protein